MELEQTQITGLVKQDVMWNLINRNGSCSVYVTQLTDCSVKQSARLFMWFKILVRVLDSVIT